MAVFKNKERSTWTAKFYYTEWTGKRKQKKKEGFPTKKAALDFENDFLNKCQTSVDITFKNLVEVYLDDCAARLKPTTIHSKTHIIYTKLIPYFGDLPISDIDVSTVRKWQNTLLSDEKNYSQTFLRTVHNQLSSVLNFAKKYYNLPNNPAALCGSMGKKKADSMQFWTPAEFNQFIAQVSNKPLSVVCFNLLFYSGMREGELLALTLNDFDFKADTINISKTYARLNGVDLIQEPKTRRGSEPRWQKRRKAAAQLQCRPRSWKWLRTMQANYLTTRRPTAYFLPLNSIFKKKWFAAHLRQGSSV